ncbi:MAG: hypothetical protein AAGC81_04195 [Pseudomonadota bacterium]
MSVEMDPSDRLLLLALMECADELRKRANFPRGLPLAETIRAGDSLTPVLVELIEAWCLKQAREKYIHVTDGEASNDLPNEQSIEQLKAGMSADEKLCLKLIPNSKPEASKSTPANLARVATDF